MSGAEDFDAVILAAGRGTRFGARTETLPKPLLPIGPRSTGDATEVSFLQRQCELMLAAGARNILVVCGYRHQQVEAAIASWGLERVRTVRNPGVDEGPSGSLHSFQCALLSGRGVLNGARPTLLADADIVYHRGLLATLRAGTAPRTTALVCADFNAGDEEVLVYGDEESPRFIGKGLTAALVGDAPCLGEATGIVSIAPADHSLATEAVNWMVGDPTAPVSSSRWAGFGPARRATEHEELTQRLMNLGRVRVQRFSMAELPFMEVDDDAEYRVLREEFYPRLLALESRV